MSATTTTTNEIFERFERQADEMKNWARKAPRGARVQVEAPEKAEKPWWKFWG